MGSLPSTFKAVVVRQPNGAFNVEDMPLKRPDAGEVLVKVLACGVCFSDVAVASGKAGNIFPRIPGHEIVGEIVEVGPRVKNFHVGERVGGPWHGGHDHICRQCHRGQFQMCDKALANGYNKDGGFGEYVTLRAEATARVPKNMDPAEVAPLLCAGVTVFNGIRKMHVEQGALVAVQGLGGLGHLALQYANKMGYEVVALSSGDDKAALAKQLGARHYINSRTKDTATELQKLGGASLIVQTAPDPNAVGGLVSGLAPEGKLLNLALVGDVKVDVNTLVMKGISFCGWPSGHALDSEEAIRFAAIHGVKCMIEKYPLSDVQKAVESLVTGKPRFRNVIVM